MTIKLGQMFVETDDSVPVREGPDHDTVIVRIKDGENWHGNTFKDCDLTLPRHALKDGATKQ